MSAVEEPDDLIKFEEDVLYLSHFVITSPSLVHKYSQHLGQLECLNWNSPLMIPLEQRQFSINNNLKVCVCVCMCFFFLSSTYITSFTLERFSVERRM